MSMFKLIFNVQVELFYFGMVKSQMLNIRDDQSS